MDISYIEACLEETKKAYRESRNVLPWFEHYRLENQHYRDYEGREILELLQNADDAKSSHVEINLDSNRNILSIKNYGENTLAFTDKGMRSIMTSYLSPKKNDKSNTGKYIGAKGLGFKSILNWTSEIRIKSDNVIVRFGNDVVQKFWDELRSYIPNPEEFEIEASKDGNIVPLPILRIPEIKEWNNPVHKTTIIELNYVPSKAEDKIKRALADFSPESLLFLHHLRNIKIVIDGEEKEYSLRKIEESEDIEICVINDTKWLVTRKDGIIEDKLYEVAAAFNLNGDRQESYDFFTFFPTTEEFPFPCILHATLELNSSRNAILTGERINTAMMPLIADRIIALADELKRRTHGWNAFRLICGNFADKNYGRYAMELKSLLREMTKEKEYVPIITGGYAKETDSYYYDDSFFDFVTNNNGNHIFNRMMLPGFPNGIRLSEDPNAEDHIQTLANSIIDNCILAKLVKTVYVYYTSCLYNRSQKARLHLFRDDKGEIITSRAYLNTGRKIADIPEFLNIKYVNDDLKKHLLEEFNLPGSEQDQVRNIANKINDCISDISSSDVRGIKEMLMLSRQDYISYTSKQTNEIIRCLFNLYKSHTEEFKKTKLVCYLPTAGNGCRQANELIFGDKRFPNGIENLHLGSSIYDDDEYVAFPEFLIHEEDRSNRTIQEFYRELGVNCYFRTTTVCYGNDEEYLINNGISKEAINNAKSSRTGNNVNITDIPSRIDNWKQLNLTDLLRLICASGLSSKIIENQELQWYHAKKWFPESLKTSYISYLLRKKTAAGKLSNYVISTKEWLHESERNFTYDDKDDVVILVLKRLGAKGSYADFTPAELYELINAKASTYEKTGNTKGIQEFYHRVKVAFVSMGGNPSLPDDVSLRMLCSIGDKSMLMDSRDIFYSNNWNSKKLQSELPILAMPLRDGEDEVNKFFGCRRIKDLKIRIINHSINSILTDELNKHLEKCKPHFLAATSKESGNGINYDKDKKSMIERLSMSVVSSASYVYEFDNAHTDMEIMTEGDMIVYEKRPLICCKSASLSDALLDPHFCNVVAESICVLLNLSSRDNTDRFYRIITASDRELSYLADCLNPDLWQACQSAFGISDVELKFWERVFLTNGKNDLFDAEKIKSEKSRYIAEHLGISIDRATVTNFRFYHIQQLKKELERFVPAYKTCLYERSKDNISEQKQYLERVFYFQSGDWIEKILDEDDLYLINQDYNDIVTRYLKNVFKFDTAQLQTLDSKIPTKIKGYDYEGLDLNLEDESLLYFDGNEDYFVKLKAKYESRVTGNDEKNSDDNSTDVENDKQPLKISIVDARKKPESTPNEHPNHKRGKGKTKRKLTDSELTEIGNAAEDAVLKALRAPNSGYDVGNIYSEHLNPDSGNNAQGYDLEYKRKEDSIYRCLEIKHFTGGSIIVSRHEYSIARSEKYRGLYDVALVNGNEIQIWKNAFSDESKYSKSADDYVITLQTDHIE